MIQSAYSASTLQWVADHTNIQPSDRRPIAILKVASGPPLKILTTAFAALELVVRTAALISASMLRCFFKEKTLTDLSATTKSAAKTIKGSIAALTTIRAAQKKEAPAIPVAPKTINATQKKEDHSSPISLKAIHAHFNDAIDYVQESTFYIKAKKHPVVTVAAIGSAIALCYLCSLYLPVDAHIPEKTPGFIGPLNSNENLSNAAPLGQILITTRGMVLSTIVVCGLVAEVYIYYYMKKPEQGSIETLPLPNTPTGPAGVLPPSDELFVSNIPGSHSFRAKIYNRLPGRLRDINDNEAMKIFLENVTKPRIYYATGEILHKHRKIDEINEEMIEKLNDSLVSGTYVTKEGVGIQLKESTTSNDSCFC